MALPVAEQGRDRGDRVLGVGRAQRWRLLSFVEQLFREVEAQNHLILEAAGEGIYGINAKGQATFVNRAAQEMLGWTTEDLLGREPAPARLEAEGTAFREAIRELPDAMGRLFKRLNQMIAGATGKGAGEGGGKGLEQVVSGGGVDLALVMAVDAHGTVEGQLAVVEVLDLAALPFAGLQLDPGEVVVAGTGRVPVDLLLDLDRVGRLGIFREHVLLGLLGRGVFRRRRLFRGVLGSCEGGNEEEAGQQAGEDPGDRRLAADPVDVDPNGDPGETATMAGRLECPAEEDGSGGEGRADLPKLTETGD